MAARTNVDIVNIAMRLLGKARLASLDPAVKDPGELIREAKASWQDAFDLAMKLEDWDECEESLSLPGSAVDGDEAKIKVQLPGDCLKVRCVNDLTYGWTRRAGPGAGVLIVEGVSPVKVTYTRRVPAGEMSVNLARLCGAQLAEDIKAHASLSKTKSDEVQAKYNLALKIMLGIDGAEDGTEQASTSSWLSAMDGL